jgi:hypothetical protein
MMNPKCLFETYESLLLYSKYGIKFEIAYPQCCDGNTIGDTFLDDLGPSPSPQVVNAIGRLDRHFEYLNMVINLNHAKSI